jgi:hypothetical protein
MSYWTPRTGAPIALCLDEACNQHTDCRRWLERRELAERNATVLPQSERWQWVPVLDINARRVGVEQRCKSFLPREG